MEKFKIKLGDLEEYFGEKDVFWNTKVILHREKVA